ncbi:hypothetical protein ES703_95469 [subsurface metagenome]
MRLRIDTGTPGEYGIQTDQPGLVDRAGIVSGQRRNKETPHVSLEGMVRVIFLDSIDAPVVGLARNQTTDLIAYLNLIAPELGRLRRGIGHGLQAVTEIDIVGSRTVGRGPAQFQRNCGENSAVRRLWQRRLLQRIVQQVLDRVQEDLTALFGEVVRTVTGHRR